MNFIDLAWLNILLHMKQFTSSIKGPPVSIKPATSANIYFWSAGLKNDGMKVLDSESE